MKRRSRQHDPSKATCATPGPPEAGPETPAAAGVSPLGRVGVVGAALLLIVFYLALIFALLWRPGFHTGVQFGARPALLAFYVDTFAFHGGVAALLLALALVAGRRWRLGLASLPAVAFTVGPAGLRYVPHDPPAISGTTVTVMTANLFGDNRRRDGLVREIAEADPDVLFVQEYNQHWHESLFAVVGDRYPHVATLPRKDFYGMAVYSKLPFEDPGVIRLYPADLGVPCLKATVQIDGGPVTLFNVHLVPPKGVKHFRAQRAQFDELLKTALAESAPTVWLGDFNFTYRSRFAERLRGQGFRAAHDLAGWGRAPTWPVNGVRRYVPGLRIDHVYLGSGLTCAACRTGVGEGSDHRPILAVIGFAG